jgi:hypothetical protein
MRVSREEEVVDTYIHSNTAGERMGCESSRISRSEGWTHASMPTGRPQAHTRVDSSLCGIACGTRGPLRQSEWEG